LEFANFPPSGISQKRQLICKFHAAAEQQKLKKRRKMGCGASTAAEPQTIVPVEVDGNQTKAVSVTSAPANKSDEAQAATGVENEHGPLEVKMATDKKAWAALNAKAVLPTNGTTFSIAMIADQDDASRVEGGVEHGETSYWLSKLAMGKLTFSGGTYTLSMDSEVSLKIFVCICIERGRKYIAPSLWALFLPNTDSIHTLTHTYSNTHTHIHTHAHTHTHTYIYVYT